MIVVIRGEENGFVDAEARRRLGLVVPHMIRAVGIGQIIDRERQEKTALAEILARVSGGIFMVDAHGKIVFANDSGQALLEEGTLLRGGQGVLAAVDPRADKALRDAFAASGGDAEIGIRGAAIPLSASSSERWLAHVLPLTSGARREAGIAFSASAAVFVRRTGIDTPSALETLATLYRLTGTEVRVLQGIVDIGGIPKVAKALGISEGTTKTHLKNLFAKTGTNRQVDLVKLVADAAGPFTRDRS
jgi:DNA-binding CsgD family transcriptional regulator